MSELAEQAETTWAAQLTPEISSAIATISLCGPRAQSIVATSFRNKSGRVRGLEIGQSAFGLWNVSSPDSFPEHVVLHRADSQHFEIHCHGGRAICRLLLEQLVSLGCTLCAAHRWPKKEMGRIEAEAESALVRAPTLKLAAILLDQFNGSLRNALAEVAAAIAGQNYMQAELLCTELLDRRLLGTKLVNPWILTLAGPPNVGKSSLTNAIFGSQRVLVHRDPGTTRDAVDATVVVSSWPVILTDTAGVRATEETIELQGIAAAERRWQSADIGLLVVDATVGWTPTHDRLSAMRSGPTLVVLNKLDLNPEAILAEDHLRAVSGLRDRSGAFRRYVCTNATKNSGVSDLLQALGEHFDNQLPSSGSAVPFTMEQVELLERSRAFLSSNQASMAELEIRSYLAIN